MSLGSLSACLQTHVCAQLSTYRKSSGCYAVFKQLFYCMNESWQMNYNYNEE